MNRDKRVQITKPRNYEDRDWQLAPKVGCKSVNVKIGINENFGRMGWKREKTLGGNGRWWRAQNFYELNIEAW